MDTAVAAERRQVADDAVLRLRAVDPDGVQTPIMFFIRVHGRSVRSVIDQLLRTEHVHSVSDVFGSVDLITRVLLATPGDANRFTHDVLDTIDGIEIVMALPDTDGPKHTVEYPRTATIVTDGVRAYVALRAHPAHLGALLADLAVRPEFTTVTNTVGDYNVLTFATATSKVHLADLADALRASPGIERSETWSVSSFSTSAPSRRHP